MTPVVTPARLRARARLTTNSHFTNTQWISLSNRMMRRRGARGDRSEAVPEASGAGAGSRNVGEGCPRPSAYVRLATAGQRARTRGHRSVRAYQAHRDTTRPRFSK